MVGFIIIFYEKKMRLLTPLLTDVKYTEKIYITCVFVYVCIFIYTTDDRKDLSYFFFNYIHLPQM